MKNITQKVFPESAVRAGATPTLSAAGSRCTTMGHLAVAFIDAYTAHNTSCHCVDSFHYSVNYSTNTRETSGLKCL